jgi:2-dehydropantoate 2-reductase
MTRIALIGPGAVGSAIAAWLGQRTELELFACARRPLDAIRVEVGERLLITHPTVWLDPAEATPVDWVLVVTKAYDAPGAARWLKRLCANGAPAAILQNGVEHRERFAPYLPPEQIVPVIVDLPAERRPDGRVRQRGPALLSVADDARGREFARFFNGTEVEVTVTSDFVTAAWRKLCLNSAGIISALTLQPAGVMRDEAIGEASRQIIREAIAVGRAEGAQLADELVETILNNYRNAPPDAMNSLHADQAAGRPTELDARNGAIVRIGRKHGIPTPANQLAVALLAAMDAQPK